MEKLIGPKEAAEVLGIKPDTLYKWTADRKIPFLKIEGAVRFRPSALQEWIREREYSATSQESRANAGRGVADLLTSESGTMIVLASAAPKESKE